MGDLKPGWKRVKFGEIAECVNDRVDDPAKAGVERYVGLEHLDPERLTIRRWGAPDEVNSTKLRFKPGDIIFGKRRAYQRKLAVADFEGICSAHAMVLRAKHGRIVPEFLPLFMQSDLFMQRAVAISVGSLSPTINWKTLAAEVFALPPPEEQRRIADVLRALDVGLDAFRALQLATITVQESALEFQQSKESATEVSLESICSIITDGEHATPPRTDAGVYLLSARNIRDEGLELSDVDYVSPETFDRLSRRISPQWGDVLISCSGSIGRVCSVPPDTKLALVRSVAIVRPIPGILLHEFLVAYLQSPRGQQQIHALTNQTAQGNLFQGSIRRIKIPLLSITAQAGVVRVGKDIAAMTKALRGRIENQASIRRHLLATGAVPTE